MISLLKCEFKKFKSTYINSLSFLGMLMPVFLVMVMFLMRRSYLMKSGGYTWDNFNEQLTMFFVFLVGPIITSFIAVFSIFYEYQQKTLKNVLASPHGRVKIIFVKIVYVSAFVLLQYILVALINVVCALLLGLPVSADMVADKSSSIILAGLSTIILVPLMMFVTLVSKSFIPAMVLTVVGTISNILVLNWERSYVSPWAAPADIAFITVGNMKMNVIYPVASSCIYFIVFMIFTLAYFKVSDQST